jgi:hypothetical protein
MPLTKHQRLQARETSSPVLLGRECKGVVVAVVVQTALPRAQTVAPAATQEQPAVVRGQSLSRALRQWRWTLVWPGGAPGPPLIPPSTTSRGGSMSAGARGGGGGSGSAGRLPISVPLQRPAVRASLLARRSSWADTGCSVAWDPLLPSLRRWSATNGSSRIPLQIHKRKHQPVSRTRARGCEHCEGP